MIHFERKSGTTNRAMLRATLLGLVAAYAVLAVLLFAFHEAPWTVADRLAPFLIIGGVGLALSIGPLLLPDLQRQLPIAGHGLGKACAKQAFAPQRMIGVMAMGMLLGALISQTVKLFIG